MDSPRFFLLARWAVEQRISAPVSGEFMGVHRLDAPGIRTPRQSTEAAALNAATASHR